MTTIIQGRVRWLVAALAAVLAALAGTLLAAPAHAASATLIHPEWVDGCPGCPGPVELRLAAVYELDERTAVEVGDLVVVGMQHLVAAKRALSVGDERDAAALVSEGVAVLQRASDATGHAGFLAADDWDGDWCGNSKVPPKPKPKLYELLTAADRLIASGITGLGQAAEERDPGMQQDLQARAGADLMEGAGLLGGFGG
jgi:hypothetical protein